MAKKEEDWTPMQVVPDGAPDPDFRHPRNGEPSVTWAYRNRTGDIVGYVARFDLAGGGKEVLPYSYCRGSRDQEEWRWKGLAEPTPLYGCENLLKRLKHPVLIVEGEKTADAATALFPEFVVVTSMGGANAVKKSDWTPLAGRDVVIWPDNDDQGRNYGNKVVGACRDIGLLSARIVGVPKPFPEKWDLADEPPANWEPDALRQLIRAAKSTVINPDKWVEYLNKRHSAVIIGGKFAILNEDWDPGLDRRQISFSSAADFRNRYNNQVVRIGSRLVNIADYWLDHLRRRQYDGITFAPKQSTPGHFNLWTDFAVKPARGDCSLFLDHVRNVIAGGDEELYEYIIAWMADVVQNPANRPGTAIVLRGKQGTGKGVFANQFGKLFGPHYVHVQHSRHLTGHFNSHLKEALVVLADEAFWAGDKAGESALKAMVTEEHLPIEFKGKDVIYVPNHIHLIVASNHDWVVPAGLEERRFLVIDVSEARMQDQKYFGDIIKQMENGGREALLHFLQEYDLEGVDLRRFPQTAALREQKIHSMDDVQKWWMDRLMDGAVLAVDTSWKTLVPCHLVAEDYIEFAGKTGYRRRSTETQLGIRLNTIVPDLRKPRPKKGNSRVLHYEFPSLAECRAHFDQITRTEHPWPEEPE